MHDTPTFFIFCLVCSPRSNRCLCAISPYKVCIYLRARAHTHARTHARVYIYVYVCVYIYIYRYTRKYQFIPSSHSRYQQPWSFSLRYPSESINYSRIVNDYLDRRLSSISMAYEHNM